jgi:hypothetical protein
MKIKLTALKPRNPFVAAAHQRQAGAHRPSTSAQRSQARRDLQRDLQRDLDGLHRSNSKLDRHRPSP